MSPHQPGGGGPASTPPDLPTVPGVPAYMREAGVPRRPSQPPPAIPGPSPAPGGAVPPAFGGPGPYAGAAPAPGGAAYGVYSPYPNARHPGPMPSGVRAAQVLLFALGGSQALVALHTLALALWLSTGSSSASDDLGDLLLFLGGVSALAALPFAGFACWGLVTAARWGRGGPGTRLSALLYTTGVAALSVSLSSALLWMYGTGLCLALAAFVLTVGREAAAWFDGRPY
ncbi:hypothetical protein ACQYWQ_10930 [Streptomyces sp. P6-2-1]|uniref:hypothetical protein n=1 Tax=Streptomyces sp. P6-2-1 TaxID=3422591 RepID=UPI003D36C695